MQGLESSNETSEFGIYIDLNFPVYFILYIPASLLLLNGKEDMYINLFIGVRLSWKLEEPSTEEKGFLRWIRFCQIHCMIIFASVRK